MPTKEGMGGHAKEAYDPATGKFIEDGKANVKHPNPGEAQKIAGGVSPQKIQKDSASTMSVPTPNLGRYAEPRKTESERSEAMDLYGIEQPKQEPKPERKRLLADRFGDLHDFDDVEFVPHDDGTITVQDGVYIMSRYEDIDSFYEDFRLTKDQIEKFERGGDLVGSDLKDNDIPFLKYKD